MLSAISDHAPTGKLVLFPKNRFRLHAMVTSAGREVCTDPGYDFDGLKRGEAPFVVLQHTIAGRGQLQFEGRRYQLGAGDTMLVRIPHRSRYWLRRGDTWDFFWICLNGREAVRLWREAIILHGPVVRMTVRTVDLLAGHCLSIIAGEADTPARASAAAYGVSMALADELLPWGGEAAAGRERSIAVENAISLSASGASQALDVGRLAAAAGYSRHHFSRLFSASEGVSPGRYLVRLRLNEALRMLEHTDDPIKQIAHRCGFADPNYFSKAFRRVFGISPRDVRRNGMYHVRRGRPGTDGPSTGAQGASDA